MNTLDNETRVQGDKAKDLANIGRRKAVKMLACGVTVLTAYNVLPSKWGTPIIEQVFLPAHAATSGPIDITAPSKIAESFPDFQSTSVPLSGTMTFDENIAAVTSISIDRDGSVSVASGIGTTTLTISGFTPNTAGNVRIRLVVEDATGNSRLIISDLYDVM